MKLAAIDIGSNAVRLQITRAIEYENTITFKKLEYIRFPLRLGHDVFSTGKISEYNKKRFFKLMSVFKHLTDLYEIDEVYGCATSAMRDSTNGKEIIEWINEKNNLNINIISGEQEAEIINQVITPTLKKGNYIHIDVGGGSTELNIYHNNQMIKSQSFQLGSVRILKKIDRLETWENMKIWIKKNTVDLGVDTKAIGTGGNINKIFELCIHGKEKREIKLSDIKNVYQYLIDMSLEDKLNKIQLNPDRADVIVPAAKIYMVVMKAAQAKKIIVPDIGLKDGLNYYMFKRRNINTKKIFVKNN